MYMVAKPQLLLDQQQFPMSIVQINQKYIRLKVWIIAGGDGVFIIVVVCCCYLLFVFFSCSYPQKCYEDNSSEKLKTYVMFPLTDHLHLRTYQSLETFFYQ